MTEGVISRVEALGPAQKQPIIHDGPIFTWRNGDPIAPADVSDVDADATMDDIVALDQPLFLPLALDAVEDIDVAAVAPLCYILANVGAENVQGALDQGLMMSMTITAPLKMRLQRHHATIWYFISLGLIRWS